MPWSVSSRRLFVQPCCRFSTDWVCNGGEAGIRTPEGLLTLAGFQDQCFQPLSHLSKVFGSV